MTDLLTALKQLRDNGPKNHNVGICGQFDLYGLHSEEERRQFRNCFKTWQHYSGDDSFPIPSPDKSINAQDAYFDKRNDLWDRDTEYGRLRWDLLDHIIAEMSKMSTDAKLCLAGFAVGALAAVVMLWLGSL